MKKPGLIKVLIVDDHQIMIDGIKSLLKNDTRIEVLGEVLNGKDALEFIKKNQVDLVISDINMPEMSGVELTKLIKRDFPEIKVLVLTMHNDSSVIKEILAAKASGYILKNTGQKELIEAIYKIADSGTYFSSDVSQTIMNSMVQKNDDDSAKLTPREIEIIKLIAQEFSNIKIADTLCISERTVETHRKNIFRKTNTKGVVGLLKYAYDHKLI